MVRKAVLLKFKDGVSESQAAEVLNSIKALKNECPGITSVEWGAFNSVETMNRGFTHLSLMTFDSFASRDAYLPHPAHLRARDASMPYIEDILVFDYAP